MKPGNDFWSYVNGSWAKTVEIPADRGALSQVARVNDLAATPVLGIIKEMNARRASLTGDEARMVDYFAALSDQGAINQRGAAPLQADLAAVRNAADRAALAAEMGKAVRHGQPTPPVGRMPRYFPLPFSVSIGQDDKQPSRYMAAIGQARLGMPDRGCYLKDDADVGRVPRPYRSDAGAGGWLGGTSAPRSTRSRFARPSCASS